VEAGQYTGGQERWGQERCVHYRLTFLFFC
jgi:hypothetical protein